MLNACAIPGPEGAEVVLQDDRSTAEVRDLRLARKRVNTIRPGSLRQQRPRGPATGPELERRTGPVQALAAQRIKLEETGARPVRPAVIQARPIVTPEIRVLVIGTRETVIVVIETAVTLISTSTTMFGLTTATTIVITTGTEGTLPTGITGIPRFIMVRTGTR